MTDLVTIEAQARAAVPARDEIVAGDWVIRVSGGSTKRVNSVNPIARGAALGALREQVEPLYAAQGLPARFRLTPLAASEVDDQLAAAGYEAADHSWTMITQLTPRAVDPVVTLDPVMTADWLTALAAASDWSPEERFAHAEMLGRVSNGGFAALWERGEPLAFGGASIAGDCACLFDIATVPAARGRGLARRVVEALLGWAAQRGCRTAILQVLDGNVPAQRLYTSLGFTDLFPYHYRIRR